MAENLCPARAEGGRLAADPRDHPCRITGLPGHIGGHSQSQGCLRSDETAEKDGRQTPVCYRESTLCLISNLTGTLTKQRCKRSVGKAVGMVLSSLR